MFANKTEAYINNSGSLIWKGSVASKNNSLTSKDYTDSVILVMRNNKISGTVRYDGRLYKIEPTANGSHLVSEINEAQMKPDHPPGAMAELDAQSAPTTIPENTQTTQVQANPVIRVLVLYTSDVAQNMPTLVDLAVEETNQGYVNSGVNATVELAHLQQVNYTSTDISTDLNRLKSTSDGYIDEAHQLRDQYAADVVMLMVPDKGSACGKAAAHLQ
ncbi:hypothetical protein [Aliikangiella maris]|uniref:Uncharacterized protein n=2 Tax=Aliikangiella maris TaxID=3162458 RepID=A0ABV3MKA9_9GAMM